MIGSQILCFSHRIIVLSRRHYRRVVVTGIGLISPLGIGVQKSWENLLAGKSGVVKVKNFDAYPDDIPCRIAAYIPNIDECLAETFTKNQLRTYSRSSLYTLMAVREALQSSGWSGAKDEQEARKCGVAIGTGMVNFEDVIDAGDRLRQNGHGRVSPHFITKILLNMPAGYVSMELGFCGPNHTVSTACTTGAHSIGDAANFIRLNHADVMLAGGVESAIHPLSLSSFCRIRALCTRYNDQPERASRPFDRDRCGFVMGESAAILMLEELEHARARNAKILGEILGYGLSSDAHHVTAPSEDGRGARYSMLNALSNGQIEAEKIGHINCHATSTPLGDQIELMAIKQLFEPTKLESLTITSTKGSTGHLLGAAGAAEAIFTLLACYHGKIPATLNLDNPIDDQ
ncbi:3-oxoacyl-acyl-carrier-protein synthase, mitochondrial-like protein, partial [Euroglyphus maynei]